MPIVLFLFGLFPTVLAASPSPLPSLTPTQLSQIKVPDVFFVRAPGDLGCDFSDDSVVAIVFSSKTEAASHRMGEKFLILLPTGEARVGEMPDPKKTVVCTPELADCKTVFVQLKVDRPFIWPTDESFREALIAIKGSKFEQTQIGIISIQVPPEVAKKEIAKLLLNDQISGESTHSAQVIAPPGLKKKFGLIHTQVFPKDYATAGDGSIVHHTSFWEIEDSGWKFISKTSGNIRVFSIISLLGDGSFQLGVSESKRFQGHYDLREFKNGVPGKVIQTFFSWMD